MIKILLWDVDGTLLDFHAAEEAAIRNLFRKFHLGECTGKMLQQYSRINKQYWERLENGQVSRQQVLTGRFQDFFSLEGIDPGIAEDFNKAYQLALGDTIICRDDSLSIVKSLRGKVRQYVVSNGTVVAQTKKLKLSGLGELMDGIFLSEQLGAEKPSTAFFDKVFESIGPLDKSQTMIIGDSLSSDIRGGALAKIRTCWYNPEGLKVPDGYRIDYEIRDLHEIYGFL